MAFKILVVDDEKDLRDLISQFLKREGYEIEVASNGFEAFEKIKASRPDLVITDVRMPVWDGYELIKNVSGLGQEPLPMLFISGYMGGDESKLVGNPNFAGFVSKPITRKTLIDLIKSIENPASPAQ